MTIVKLPRMKFNAGAQLLQLNSGAACQLNLSELVFNHVHVDKQILYQRYKVTYTVFQVCSCFKSQVIGTYDEFIYSQKNMTIVS